MIEQKVRKLKKLEDEEWREIKGTNGKYFISSYGRVKSFCYDKVKGKILETGLVSNFKAVYIRVNGKQKNHTIHKLVAEAFVPKPSEEYTHVTHIDWNRGNNHYTNLQ